MKRVDTWEQVAAVALHVKDHMRTSLPISGFTIAMRLDKLARIGASLHRLYEVACNEDVPLCRKCLGSGTEENGVCHGRKKHFAKQCFYYRVESLEKRAEDIGLVLGIVVTAQRDPRGASIKLWADKEEGRMLACF